MPKFWLVDGCEFEFFFKINISAVKSINTSEIFSENRYTKELKSFKSLKRLM